MLRSAFTLIALVGYASAQLNGISSDCENAFEAIIANQAAGTCLNAATFIPVAAAGNAVGSGGSGETSFIADLNNWFNGICSVPKCSNGTLADVVKNLTQGCASYLNITDSSVDLTSTVQELYPTLRKLVCLKESQTSCVTQFLVGIQGFFSITLFNVLNFMDFVKNVTVSNLPSNITCTDCTKAILNVVNNADPSVGSELSIPLASECGQSFTDGVTPTGVIESASTSTALSSSASSTAFSGVSLLSHGIVTGLVVISALLLLP